MRELLQAVTKESDPCLNEEFRKGVKGICASYLGGNWESLPLERLQLVRVKGATSNALFVCKLSGDCKLDSGEPNTILLRLYFKPDKDNNIVDTIVFALLSEREMGPKLYGVFDEGRIEQFIESRSLTADELAVPRISNEIAKSLAKVHQLKIPILKQPNYLYNSFDRWLNQLDNTIGKSRVFQVLERFWDLMPRELHFDNLKKEVQHLKHLMAKNKSLVVFCHNDLQEGNILLPTKSDHTSDLNLVFIDFEYASYNYRGFDFANHFVEYSISYDYDEPPYYKINTDKFPSEDHMRSFASNYLTQIKPDISGSELDLEADLLIKESLPFVPCSHLFWSVWGFLQSVSSPLTFGFAEYAQDRLYAYFKTKHLLQRFEGL